MTLLEQIENASYEELKILSQKMVGRLLAVHYSADNFPTIREEMLQNGAEHFALMLMYDIAGK